MKLHMRKILCLVFLMGSVEMALAQEGEFVPTRRAPDPKYTIWGDFVIENGNCLWQYVYPCTGMKSDSIKEMIVSAVKGDAGMMLVREDGNELTMTVEDKVKRKDGFTYKGKLIVNVKDEKYRITYSLIAVPGADPQGCVDGSGKYFRIIKLEYLTSLDKQFQDNFNFKTFPPSKTLSKDF